MHFAVHPLLNAIMSLSENGLETIEDLQLNGLKLLQRKDGFRFGMDTVILSDFATIRPGDTVADFGTGNGIIPLLLIGRGKGRYFYAFEIQSESADLARRNMLLNRVDDRVTIFQDDVLNAPSCMAGKKVDCVIANPPYGIPGKVLNHNCEKQEISRNQETDTMDRFLSSASRILKGRGRIAICYPAAQMLFLMDQLKSYRLEPKRFQLVYPFEDRAPKLVLIEAVKDARPMLHPLPPLVIYQKNGDLTNRLKSIYHLL